MGLDRVARRLHEAIGDVRLRQRRRARRLLEDVVEGVCGIPVETARRLDLDRHVRELVLERLEVADRHAELLARVRVLDRHLDTAARAAEGIGREQDQSRVAHPARCRGSVREDLARSVLQRQLAEPARAVDALDRLALDALRAPLDDAERTAGQPDHRHVGQTRIRNVALGAAHQRAGRDAPVLGLPARVALGKGDRRDRLAGGELRQPGLLLLVVSRQQDRQPGQRVAQEGTRRRAAAEGLGDQRQVQHLEPCPSVLVGQRDPAQPELDHAAPDVGLEAGLGVEDLAHLADRAASLEKLPDGVLK